MQKLVRFFKLFFRCKLIFKTPEQKSLVVFDDTALNELKLILKGREYFLIKNRYENIDTIFISFKIILCFLKFFRGNVNTAYLATIIYLVNPKLVITFIDNSSKFHDLAKIFRNKISFLAIQQSVRNDLIWKDYDYKKGLAENSNKKIFLPIFLIFGLYEKKLFKRMKINVKEFYVTGSLRLANFIEFLKNKKKHKLKKKYDVCLVSDNPPGNDKAKFIKLNEDKINKSIVTMIKHTILFCKKNNKTFIFTPKAKLGYGYDLKSEMSFYKKNLSKEDYNFLLKNSSQRLINDSTSRFFNKDFSSYISIFQSDVVIGMMTSMLREKMSLGGKILVCNFSKLNIFNFPIKKFLSIKNSSYYKFEKHLLFLLSQNESKFYKKIKINKNFIIEDTRYINTIKKINDIINLKIRETNVC